MKLENFLMSDEKWNDKDGVVAELMKPGRVDWGKVYILLRKECGHCREHYKNSRCHCCPLDNFDLCGDDSGDVDGYFFLEDMATGKVNRDKPKALRIAKRIYKAILEDDPRGK